MARFARSTHRINWFTNISRVDGATRSLIAQGVYGIELEKRLRHSAAHELNVKNVLEVLPHPEHRITLAPDKDAMGLPKPQAHYAIDDYTRKGHERSKQDFRRIAELMGGTNLRFSKEGDFANNQHICGTLSMGLDPRTAVCDQWGRAHDHENLFLASTGVMPTSATVNSTENGLALALRTAQHVLAEQTGARAPRPARSNFPGGK